MMKNIPILGLLLLCFLQSVFSQCDPKGISTDPANPVNPELPEKKNTFFDWTKDAYDTYLPTPFGPEIVPLSAPFSQRSNSFVDHIYGNEFRPEDGWELLRWHLGFNENGAPHISTTAPFFILYNRYNGRVRIFSALGDIRNPFSASEISLQFLNSAGGRKRAVFGHADDIMEPVQTFNPQNYIVSVQANNNDPYTWETAEFQMAYDPCTCTEKNQVLLFEVNKVYEADVLFKTPIGDSLSSFQIDDFKQRGGAYYPEGTRVIFKKPS